MRHALVLFAFLAICPLTSALHADELVLKDGKEYTNVRVVIQSDYINLILKSGEIVAVPKSKAKLFKRRPVDWKTEFPEDEFEAMMKKRIDALHKRIKEQQTLRKSAEQSFRYQAMLRSAAVPGWGHFYKGESGKGFLFAGGFAASFAFWRYYDQRFTAALNRYDTANLLMVMPYASGATRSQAFQVTGYTWSSVRASLRSMQQSRDATRFGLVLTLGLHLYNVIDAFFFGSVDSLMGPEESEFVSWRLDLYQEAPEARPAGEPRAASEGRINLGVRFVF